ncbi:hypothetical protein [Sphingobium cloacae]|uniref:Uncharacterized protein n=1 Tax=Sphingobium cloacae TaxID=120107 RepID=A0A1E1F3K6_9SPHN|nr:hypothetical protein [Sphingobium cloacae]BAV65099.1 hypothetical protein SCLO_1020590 [Sphingobium cloacae]
MGLFDLNSFLAVGGFIIGVVGLLYAFYQGSEKKKLEGFVKSQNWHLYSKTNNANGQLQLAVKLYRERYKDKLDPDVLANLEKSDAWCQDVFKEVIRQIQLSEKAFDSTLIDHWISTGKINEHHANALFRNLIP